MTSSTHDSVAGGDAGGPARFGRYAVVRELGKGGMAQVFEGRHVELGSRVALKVMQPTLAAQPLAAARFLREAKAASHIRHPNVVEVFDIGTENGLPFIVMEFLEGSNLAMLLSEKGPLSLAGIVDVFLPVVSAVATAHAAGIIHRDLKPANLMITRRPPRAAHPMVLDFGISKITNEEMEGTFTRSESLLGTVQYMAPELTRGAKFASAASDQYALGVMLYECATGRRPFAGDSPYELMHAIVTAPVIPPSRLEPCLPPEFDALVERAMHRDPAKRFPSVAALGSALLSFGDKTAWALWESEFTGTAVANEPWAATQQTLHDDPSTPGIHRDLRVPRARAPWRYARTALVGVSAYALVMTVLVARRPASEEAIKAPSVPVSSPGSTVSDNPPPPAAAASGALASAPARAVPEATPASSGAEIRSNPSAQTPPGRTRVPGEPTPKSKSAATSQNPAPPPAPPSAPPPAVLVGTNGAPIVD